MSSFVYLFVASFTLSLSFAAQANAASEKDEHELSDVRVTTSPKQEIDIEQTGLNVDVLEIEELHNSSKDINQVLNAAPGVIVRLEGGLGSSAKLSINGLSDKQIRYFIDGVPMENFGTAMTLDNYVVNLVNQVEVYKGVVPTSLGADALGGAINIISSPLDQDHLDVSYSYGSFNTHRLAASGQKVNDAGVFVNFNSFYNYSDNDYEIDTILATDEFGNIGGTQSAKRFNDEYRSRMLALKAGIANQTWADELSANITKADNRNNIQHPLNNINDPWGKFHTRNKTDLASLNYKLNSEKFDIHAYYLQGKIIEIFNDSSPRNYSWDGSYEEVSGGEGEYRELSILDLTDKVSRGKLQVGYKFVPDHKLSLSLAANSVDRHGKDRINDTNNLYLDPTNMEKSVTALSYDFLPQSLPFNLGAFVKHYRMTGHVEFMLPITGARARADVESERQGFGLLANYDVNDIVSVKASYEDAYRLPEPDELLGFGFTVRPNADLEPEQSDNYNLGLIAKFSQQDLYSKSEVNLFNRQAKDFIRFNLDRTVSGIYENVTDVDVTGIEISQLLDYQNTYSLNFNITYQELINTSKYDKDGRKDFNNGSRIPNEPYLFGGIDAKYKFSPVAGQEYSISWLTQYVHEYFLHWENLGNQSSKSMIETSVLHDIELTSSFAYGTYNLSLSANNIFDEQVFDNYNLQKPGRSFYLKFRFNY